jgi:hypothetical protein
MIYEKANRQGEGTELLYQSHSNAGLQVPSNHI